MTGLIRCVPGSDLLRRVRRTSTGNTARLALAGGREAEVADAAQDGWFAGQDGRSATAEESARVAARLATPSDDATRAGLPLRRSRAHLVPGAFETGARDAAPLARGTARADARLPQPPAPAEGELGPRRAGPAGGLRSLTVPAVEPGRGDPAYGATRATASLGGARRARVGNASRPCPAGTRSGRWSSVRGRTTGSGNCHLMWYASGRGYLAVEIVVGTGAAGERNSPSTT